MGALDVQTVKRGNAILKAWEQRLVDDRNAAVVTARCAFCDWELDGTVQDTRAAYLEHRTAEHPEVRPPHRRQRHRPFGAIHANSTLDDNIARAREQGAAGWAGQA